LENVDATKKGKQ